MRVPARLVVEAPAVNPVRAAATDAGRGELREVDPAALRRARDRDRLVRLCPAVEEDGDRTLALERRVASLQLSSGPG